MNRFNLIVRAGQLKKLFPHDIIKRYIAADQSLQFVLHLLNVPSGSNHERFVVHRAGSSSISPGKHQASFPVEVGSDCVCASHSTHLAGGHSPEVEVACDRNRWPTFGSIFLTNPTFSQHAGTGFRASLVD